VNKFVLAAAGAIAVAGAVIPAAAAAAPSGHPRPSWLHIGRVRHYDACHGKGVIVWQAPVPGGGGTSALHCKDGKTFLS